MPKSETSVPPVDLLHDLSRSSSKREVGDERLQDIMRLAGDPLLLRDYLRRQERPKPPRPVPLELPGLLLGACGCSKFTSSATIYARQEDVPSASLHPEVFVATPEDRALALEEVDPAAAMNRLPSTPWLWLLLAASSLAMITAAYF